MLWADFLLPLATVGGGLCGVAGARYAKHFLAGDCSRTLLLGICIVSAFFGASVAAIYQTWTAWGLVTLTGSMLIAASAIDLRTMLLPNTITLTAAPLAILTSAIFCENGWAFALAGAGTGAGVLLSIAAFYQLLRKRQGLGMGDVKLMLALGAFTGPQGVLHTLLFASLTLLCTSLCVMLWRKLTKQGKKLSLTTPLPFGPFLCLSAWIIVMLQQTL